ncbi:MAG: DUF3775 domain-containing protein [Alphaproteobacteria bacterium]|nr:DUF3775 domain-containing protein [Alphaproteobacteria bacterium]
MLDRLGAEYVRSVIALARETGAAGDRLRSGAYSADLGDEISPAAQAAVEVLAAAIARLSPEARRELRAVMMIGRGDFAAAQWEQAVAQAQALSDASEIRALAEEGALAAYLSKGLYQLDLA